MTEIPYVSPIFEYLKESPVLSGLVAFSLIMLVASIANYIVKKILLRILARLLKFTSFGNDPDILRMAARLANIIPAIIVIEAIRLVPHMPETLAVIIKNVSGAFIVVSFAMAVNALIDVCNTLYMRRPGAAGKSIKGYLQVVKIAVSAIATILALAALIDKSPLILLSGLGAMAAVMMLVFQDTLLSLVASIQISSGNLVKLGDWIEMPALNADGDVIDIALHTVKVQNWDKTITTIPTRKLVSESFKNWRGMTESGGRRIKRAISLDQNSIHFLTPDEEEHLRKFVLLKEYLAQKDEELAQWNRQMPDADPLNARRLTNIGTFRAYVEQYLKNHAKIHKGMTLIVRQLSPGPTGLPIEIYCFTNTTVWAAYEAIQSDIFDHLYAVLPEFGLHAFQEPSGHDFCRLTNINTPK